jgi:hypothetical protein
MGVSAPVELRLPPGHVHNLGFLLAHLTRLWVVKSNGFAPPGPPGNSGGANLAIPARPSGAAPEGLYTARFPKALELKKRPTRRMWALVQLRPQTHHHPDQPAAHTAFQTHWARLVSNNDQLRDHTGQKRRYWLVLKEIIRAAPCFFLHVLAWY